MNIHSRLLVCLCLLAALARPVSGARRGEPVQDSPATCGKGDEKVMQKLEKALLGRRVELPDCGPCGGSRETEGGYIILGNSIKFQLPEFCDCEKYVADITFTANLWQWWGYFVPLGGTTAVFDGKELFHREIPLECTPGGNSCAMETWTKTLRHVELESGSWHTLGYSANDLVGRGCYVEITEVVVRPDDPCPEKDGKCLAGGMSNDCAHFRVDLGGDSFGHSAGILDFEYDTPTALAASRAGLTLCWNPADPGVRVFLEDAAGRLYSNLDDSGDLSSLDDPDEAPRGTAAGLSPRRIVTPKCVVDLADIDGGYEIRGYLPGQASPAQGHLDELSGTPFKTWRIRSLAADGSRLQVDRLENGYLKHADVMEYDEEAGGWSLDDGVRIVSRGEEELEGGDVLRWLKVMERDGTTARYRANVCHAFDWGEEVVEERDGLPDPRVTTHEYYDDEGNDGDDYGHLKETVEWDGSWTRYTYTEDGRIATEASPWLDSPRGTPDALCRVVEYSYDGSRTTTVEKTLGVETSRSYDFDYGDGETASFRAAGQGAAWDAYGNLQSWSSPFDGDYMVPDGTPTPFDGTTASSRSSDGTALQRSFTLNGDGTWTVVTAEGRMGYSSIVSGTRTEELCASDGKVLSRRVSDIESNLVVSDDEYELDDFGRTVRTIHADGTSESVEYGCCGAVSRTGRDGSVEVTEYDEIGRVTSRTSNGVTTDYELDAAGRIVAENVRGAAGGRLTTRYEYDEYGERTAVVSPGGLRTEYRTEIINGHRVETVVHPDGGTEVTTYRLDGSVASVGGTAAIARQYTHSVGSDGVMTTRTTYADGAWEESTRDFLGRTAGTSWSDGTSSSMEYDAKGRVARSTSAGGVVALRTYDDSQYGDITAVDMDGNGSLGLYGTDLAEASRTDYVEQEGRVMRRTRSWRWQNSYSSSPTLVSQSLESVDGLLSIGESMGRTVRTETALLGGGAYTVTTSVDGISSATVREYGNGRLDRSESEADGVTLYDYDQFGRSIGMASRANGVTIRRRDALDADGRVTASAVTAAGETRTTRYTYDAAGRTASETRPDGTSVSREYDAMGNVVLEHGDTYRVAYAYDSRGRMASMDTFRDGDSDGDRTSWAYDAKGRMVRKTYADGTHADCAYDADGNMVSRTSARGTTATSAYDAAGRLVSVSFSDGTPSLAYSYDRAGRVVSVTDAAGTRTLSYDADGNCLSEGLPHVAGKTVARTFDATGRRTGLALGTDLSATYAYDGFGRVSSVASGADTVAFDYRAHGNALAGRRWLRNGLEVAGDEYAFDAWGNVTGISFGAADGEIRSMGYSYDMADRRTQTYLPDGTSWRYGYDRLSQVVSGERVNTDGTPVQDGSFRYEYDGIGNRTFSQDGAPNAIRRYSSNALNQYTAIAETGFIPLGGRADEDANVVVTATVDGRSETYVPVRDGQGFSVDIPVDNSRGAVTATVRVDALKHDGQQASDLHRSLAGEYTVAAAVPETPSYDADGNMLSNDGWTYAWNAQDRLVSVAKGAIRLEFAYDYMGRRFEKKVYENDVLTKRSLYAYDGFKQIAEFDALDNNALLNTYLWQPVGLDVPLLRNNSEFYVSDANKNVVALMDTTGAVTDTYVYDPFGNCAHAGDSANPFRFSSEHFDEETGLVYYNYRYYSPELGRWTKRDPIGERGGININLFINNNSNDFDIGGLESYWQRVRDVWSNPIEESGATWLGMQLAVIYLSRCARHIGGHGLLNYWHSLSQHALSFYDFEEELIYPQNGDNSSLRININEKIKEDSARRQLTNDWKCFDMPRTKITTSTMDSGHFLSAGWWLHGAHANHITGGYCAKCTERGTLFKAIIMHYEWFDEIDANSIQEAIAAAKGDIQEAMKNFTQFWVEGLFLDPVFEKTGFVSYFVNIEGDYIINEENGL